MRVDMANTLGESAAQADGSYAAATIDGCKRHFICFSMV
jgi:hypothetical protein